MLSGQLVLPSAFSPIEWRVHDSSTAMCRLLSPDFPANRRAKLDWPPAGRWHAMVLFLTGRRPHRGLSSRSVGPRIAAAIDLLFLTALGLVVAREIIAGNKRNLKVLGVVALLLLGNGLFHLEALARIGNGHSTRLGIAAIVMLIMLVGGRIIPSFTRNWLRGAGQAACFTFRSLGCCGHGRERRGARELGDPPRNNTDGTVRPRRMRCEYSTA